MSAIAQSRAIASSGEVDVDVDVPAVSIVMATNSTGPQFAEALQSCMDQDFLSIEIIVVANGVDDEAFNQLKAHCRDNRIRLLRTDMYGITFSLNLGLNASRGRYVARMDSDDISYPGRIGVQVRFMDANPAVSVCGTWCDLVDRNGDNVGEWRYASLDRDIRRNLFFRNPLCHPTVIFRRRPLAAIGGYSGFLAEDYVAWANLSVRADIVFANIPQKLLAYRANDNDHPRNARWAREKAAMAGVQIQLFLQTWDFRWLAGFFLNAAKSLLRRSTT